MKISQILVALSTLLLCNSVNAKTFPLPKTFYFDGNMFLYENANCDENKIVLFEKEKVIGINLCKNEAPVLIENINDDDTLELWTFINQGDGLFINLYQFDKKLLLEFPQKKINIKSSLGFNGWWWNDPQKFQDSRKDLDFDGSLELIALKKTHPLFGTQFNAGRIYWSDIYEIKPSLKLANENYKSFYCGEYQILKNEIDLLSMKIEEYKTSLNEDENALPVYRRRIKEAEDYTAPRFLDSFLEISYS